MKLFVLFCFFNPFGPSDAPAQAPGFLVVMMLHITQIGIGHVAGLHATESLLCVDQPGENAVGTVLQYKLTARSLNSEVMEYLNLTRSSLWKTVGFPIKLQPFLERKVEVRDSEFLT